MRMTQIIIETDDIKRALKWVLIGMLIIGLVAATGVIAYTEGRNSVLATQTRQQEDIALPVTPSTPVPAPAFPVTLTFTVLSTTMGNGIYQVTTTSGQTLIMSEFYTWNEMFPRGTYTATVTGMSGSSYIIGSVTSLVPLSAGNTNLQIPSMVALAYPSSISFTVLSTTNINGIYRVLTTAGQTFIVPDYSTWCGIDQQDSYTATVTGVYGNEYYITSVVPVSQRIYVPPLYENNNRYWRYWDNGYPSDDGTRHTRQNDRPPVMNGGTRVFE